MKFRKKPVQIEARQLPGGLGDPNVSVSAYLNLCLSIADWCGGASHMMVNDDEQAYRGAEVVGPHMVIHTLEGDMIARPDDWIIKGVQGEFYPCKPDIFEQTYEPV